MTVGRSVPASRLPGSLSVFSQPGALPAAALEQVIAGIRALDMDQVRTELHRQQPAASAPNRS
jgi:hypothetical protein